MQPNIHRHLTSTSSRCSVLLRPTNLFSHMSIGNFAAAMVSISLVYSAITTPFASGDAIINNTKLLRTDIQSGTADVRFDLHWDHAWRIEDRTSTWNAVWIFVKFQPPNGKWAHATLSTSPEDHKPNLDAELHSGDGTGVLLFRAEEGDGPVIWTGNQLQWQYAGDKAYANADIQIFAIEMTLVPQTFFLARSGSGSIPSTRITTSDSRRPPTKADSAHNFLSGGYPQGRMLPDNSNWPNGFAACYVMTRLLTNKQYVDFLNTLVPAQAKERLATNNAKSNDTITEKEGIYQTSAPKEPFISKEQLDGAAFAAWSGLRPITELEFEKICNDAGAGTAASRRNAPGGRIAFGIEQLSPDFCQSVVSLDSMNGRRYTGMHGQGKLSAEALPIRLPRWPTDSGWKIVCGPFHDSAATSKGVVEPQNPAPSVPESASGSPTAGARFARSAP